MSGAIWLIIIGVLVACVILATFDDGRCAKAGGVYVRQMNGISVCVKPIDLERN